MTTLLEQAFTAASALPQTEQDEIANDISRRLEARKNSRRSLLKMPLEQRRQINPHSASRKNGRALSTKSRLERTRCRRYS